MWVDRADREQCDVIIWNRFDDNVKLLPYCLHVFYGEMGRDGYIGRERERWRECERDRTRQSDLAPVAQHMGRLCGHIPSYEPMLEERRSKI